MKLPILAVVFAVAVSLSASAQTTFSVIKVSAALPCTTQSANGVNLVKVTLRTKDVINIALDKDVTTKVPKNVVLGFAGDFANFGHVSPNSNGPTQLVVFDTNTMTKLKTIGMASNTSSVENRVQNKYSRVFLSTLTIQDTNGVDAFFSSGSLQVSGTAKRSPNAVADPATLKVVAPATVVGTVNASFRKSGVLQVGGIVAKGALVARGKIVGTFTE
jgi:hypothetical protein